MDKTLHQKSNLPTKESGCPQVQAVLYTRKFIDYEHQPLYKHELELYGIKDQCCKDFKNICYTDSNEFLACNTCNRLFKWSRKTKKVKWIEEHFVGFIETVTMIGVFCGALFVMHLGGNF